MRCYPRAPFTFLLLLLLFVAATWLTIHARWNPQTWSAPSGPPGGDLLEIAARVQIAAEQWSYSKNTYGAIERLGAPAGADWSGYPVPDRITLALAGLLARFLGVYGAIHALMLLAHLLGAASFYGCARLLRWHPALAAAGALVFTFAVFNQQWSGTLSLGWTFALPPAVVLFQWIASRSAAPPAAAVRRMTWLAAGTGLWLGGANPYHVFVAAQLLAFALLLQWVRSRTSVRLRAGAVMGAALLATFGLTHAPELLARLSGGDFTPMERNYGGSELYALKPIELLLPPETHRSETLTSLRNEYSRVTLLRSNEPPGSYLGLIGIAGLGLLAFALLRDAFARRIRPRPTPDAALATIWVVILAAVGGINSLFAFLGLDLFRASNRFVIFILIWSLFAVFGWVRRRTLGRPAIWKLAAAAIITFVGLADQLPRSASPDLQLAGAAALEADRATAARIADSGGRDAAVFQLPAVPFPEAGPAREFPDYDHFRLFLAGPGLRLAYGGMRGSLPDRWTRWAAGLPSADLVEELEEQGFSALVIDRRAYRPPEVHEMIAKVKSTGRAPLPLPESPHLVAFRLRPPPRPGAPHTPDDPRFHRTWDRSVPGSRNPNLSVHAFPGWFSLERDHQHVWRWAGRRARMGMWNGAGKPRPVRMSGQIIGASPGWLNLQLNGTNLSRMQIGREPVDFTDLYFTLPAGPSHLDWHFEGSLVRPRGDPRSLGFQARNLTVTPEH